MYSESPQEKLIGVDKRIFLVYHPAAYITMERERLISPSPRGGPETVVRRGINRMLAFAGEIAFPCAKLIRREVTRPDLDRPAHEGIVRRAIVGIAGALDMGINTCLALAATTSDPYLIMYFSLAKALTLAPRAADFIPLV